MRKAKKILFLVWLAFTIVNVQAQVINWSKLEGTRHLMNVNVGLDYSLSYEIGYSRKLNTMRPLIIGAHFAMPSGNKLFDDFKTKIGGQVSLLNHASFIGAVSLFGIYRKYQSELVRLQNFGSDLKVTFGYYKPRWVMGAEAGFDKAIITHFKHAQKYRDDIYHNAVDGWFEPGTGGNIYYGLNVGYSFRRSDITIRLGKVISQDLQSTPLLPFYFSLGFNYRR